MDVIRNVNRSIAIGLMALGIVSIAQGSAGATVLTFTDQAAWEAALPGATFLTETFDGPANSFAPNSFGNPAGLVTIDIDGGDDDSGPTGITGTGFLQGELDSSGPGELKIDFNRPNMIGVAFLGFQIHPVGENAFDLQEIGFDFGPGSVIGFEFLLCEVLGLCSPTSGVEQPDVTTTDPVPFVGFVFDAPRNSFQLEHGDDTRDLEVEGSNEPFFLDGLIIAEPVPEPSSLALMAIGLVCLLHGAKRLTRPHLR